MTGFTVAALYKFTSLPDFTARQAPLRNLCEQQGIKGTLLLAPEGVNGTIAGHEDGIEQVLGHLRRFPACADMEVKKSLCAKMPFYRMKVRLKKEIVTMGVDGIDPNESAGQYVDPDDWNELIANPEVTVIDTRNDYEVAIGTFAGAIDPQTETFRDFPQWATEQTAHLPKDAPIAMFCTGGIRCEKATAFLRQRGFENVYHLKGGILKYLETVEEPKSLWQGECFVFDQRTAITHGLEQGSYDLCHACRRPISASEKASKAYEKGVSCPKCIAEIDDDQRGRFRMRQRQIDTGHLELGRTQPLAKVAR